MVPTFIDANGTTCAVADLLIADGQASIADEIQRTANFARVSEMRVEDLAGWADQAGLTPAEVALIQPDYCPNSNPCVFQPSCGPADCTCPPATPLADGEPCDMVTLASAPSENAKVASAPPEHAKMVRASRWIMSATMAIRQPRTRASTAAPARTYRRRRTKRGAVASAVPTPAIRPPDRWLRCLPRYFCSASCAGGRADAGCGGALPSLHRRAPALGELCRQRWGRSNEGAGALRSSTSPNFFGRGTRVQARF